MGIALNLVATERAIAYFINRKRRRKMGQLPLPDHFRDHIVLLGGWFPVESRIVLDDLVAHFGHDAKIAIGLDMTDPVAECPDGRALMVKGDLLSQKMLVDDLRIGEARAVVAMGYSDDATGWIATAVRRFNKRALLVAAAHVEPALDARIALVDTSDDATRGIVTVLLGSPRTIAKAVTAPGSSRVMDDLLDTAGDSAGWHTVEIPEEVGAIDTRAMAAWFLQQGILVIGVDHECATGDTDLLAKEASGGQTVHVNSAGKVDPASVPWDSFRSAVAA